MESDNIRRRASKACTGCRTRKIRCDVLQVGQPCTKCQIDKFECTVQDRKKRRRKDDVDQELGRRIPAPQRSLPEHILHHQIPYYTLFRNMKPTEKPWILGKDRDHGLILPVALRGHSVSSGAGDPAGVSEDVAFLKQKGGLNLPPNDVLDECVSVYFRIFHPFFPIVDKPAFLRLYAELDGEAPASGQGPSLLLLQAITFTGVSMITEEGIRKMGFSSHQHARSCLHSRVRYLHNFNYESDDITTIQALLLMSHYYPSMAEQRHTWFWVHQAIGLAQGAGLHRDSGNTAHRKLWARIWWACLIRDRLVALGTGRPMHINSLDCSVPLLTAVDLEEEGDTDDDRTIKSMFADFARLCYYMEGVLFLPSLPADTLQEQSEICESTLLNWADTLSDPSRLSNEVNCEESEGRAIPFLYRALLHLIYNVVLMMLYQNQTTIHDSRPEGSHLPSPKTQSVATTSVALLNDLMRLDLVQFCPTQSVTVTLPPLVVQLSLMRFASQEPDRIAAKDQFDICMQFLKQLSRIYWHANFYHELFGFIASEGRGASGTHLAPQTQLRRQASRENAGFHASNTNDAARTPALPENSFGDIVAGQAGTFNGQIEDVGASSGPDCGQSGSFGFQNQEMAFEDWLDDYLLFQNLFPSA